MPSGILLEISVETPEGAVAAQRGGAHRIELCADLGEGGLTPSTELMRSVRERVTLPIFAMIRPHPGDFTYSDNEREIMQRDILSAKRLGMDGIVFGVLTKRRCVDIDCTRALVKAAQPLPVTFHRAFDAAIDLDTALENIIKTGAARILTSGGAASAFAGVNTLRRLVAAAGDRIRILPGGGINKSNALNVARQVGARELHSGLGSVLAYDRKDYNAFESEVREMAAQLADPI